MKTQNCWTSRFEAMRAVVEQELKALDEKREKLEEVLRMVDGEIEASPSPSMIRWLRANEKVS